jgi:DNA-binding PadR family transcriptional regulator
MNFDAIVRIKRSSTKIPILNKLLTESLTPTILANLLNLHRASVSQSLLDLQKDGFVECLTKKGRNFHYYKITSKGKKGLSFVEQMPEVKK